MAEFSNDLSAMDKQDASKLLFSQINWQELVRAGMFLSQSEYLLLERAQDNLNFAMNNKHDASTLAGALMKIADNCTSNLSVQQYVFTRVEEILGLNPSDFTGTDHEAFVKQRAPYFTIDGINIQDGPFLRGIRSKDAYTQRSASLGLACLLTAREGEVNALVTWICEQLASSQSQSAEIAIPALSMIMRRASARKMFCAQGGVMHISNVLKRLGVNGSAQQIYDLSFCLWTVSLGEDTDLRPFLHAGTCRLLTDLLATAPSRKVVRMSLATLRNLASSEDDDVLTELLTGGLQKLLENMIQANAHKQTGDPEVESDARGLFEVLMKNYRELSTFERWISEVHSGSLRPGIVHTEKFWRENAKCLEVNDFKLLKTLITLLRSDDLSVVSIALYDVGEFTRFYPNGRGIVKTLGAKDIAMEMIGHENAEIQRQALQCISKIMVTNWEFMR
eukprot:gene4206-8366_t